MTSPQAGRAFIGHLHAFRGVAIMLIVGTHAFVTVNLKLGLGRKIDPYLPVQALSETVFHNSTVFFALISGLLFSAILSGRGWWRFYRGKLLYVIVPYALFTALLTWFYWSFPTGYRPFIGTLSEFAAKVGSNILSGKAIFPFWYIPVLAGLFLLTPVLSWLLKSRAAPLVLATVLIAPLFVSRTFPNIGLNNLVFFTGPYAFGIWLGADYEARMALVSRWRGALLGLLVIGTIASAMAYVLMIQPARAVGNGHWIINPFESATYVQKMALACLVLLWLKAREGWLPRWLDLLATNAFTIFFVHQTILFVWQDIANRVITQRPSMAGVLLAGVVWWALALTLSLGLTLALKRALGKRARLLIGS